MAVTVTSFAAVKSVTRMETPPDFRWLRVVFTMISTGDRTSPPLNGVVGGEAPFRTPCGEKCQRRRPASEDGHGETARPLMSVMSLGVVTIEGALFRCPSTKGVRSTANDDS